MFALHLISIVVFMFSLGQTTDMQDGHLPRPSIFADPGNVLPSGISLVITCRSPAGFERFRLEKENLRIVDVINSSSSKTEARFYLGTVRKDTAGHYSCLYKVKNTWSPQSETLQLKVIREDITETSSPISEVTSVESKKPLLSAWPSPIVPIGERVTLYCQSELGFETFSLFKEHRGRSLQTKDFNSQQSFVIGPVTTEHAGIYRCQGFDSKSLYGSSELSDSLVIVVTGIYRKPSLLALPAPLVKSGGAVTLKCYSEIVFETFSLVLHRKGLSTDPLYLVGEPCDGGYQANISIAPVTSEHTGTYRCYGFVSLQPYEWSDPSDSLDIKITEAQEYYLYKDEGSKPLKTQILLKPGDKANFSIPFMTEYDAGLYHCYYYSPAGWSNHSDFLELVVTGFYSKPNISALPSSLVASGGNVTLQCSSHQGYGRWAFRCYGYYKRTSQMWSIPSETLQLLLSDSPSQDHTVENLIRMAVAGLVLVVLGILLFEARNSQGHPQGEVWR
ncbi:putative killer cell immunoglobulin-like receptor like protein KIR3DP1 isoform X2 [Cricetulus griseus]|uniref:Killer cell immunoglobulin-like receptor like protein KIR3DP1 isoform X2 n=1 Tax=Cricetulus griseus TaxID=10029 RepID=A0A9J7H873_CRIGR|nr:putative killer cell immunoglobulin-like receptor like protein KIR3DP1 isoform X2 [Cricetulus griseus]